MRVLLRRSGESGDTREAERAAIAEAVCDELARAAETLATFRAASS